MTRPGEADQPLRVAIVGSGPSGFYTAEKLLKPDGVAVEVDMYDRLPVPFGLVRFGVAPDHEKIKNVTRVYNKVAAKPNFRFYGNVEVGMHVTLDDLRRHYHQIVYCTGAQTDRRMGIPGEDLERSHPATEFVAWYNGHPGYCDREFDLSVERVAVVGVGNVAVDVARILCRTREELEKTDIAEYALEALSASNVREVYILGRRGPAQAAFTNPEVKELGELDGADFIVLPEEAELDALSRQAVDESNDKALRKKIEILQGCAERRLAGKPKKLTLRFLVSPVELYGDHDGKVRGMKLVQNELYVSEDGSLRPRHTDRLEELDVDMVFRSVGYRGMPIAGLPFHDRWAVIPNERGRVIDPDAKRVMTGIYVAGWIKRGPTGIIGTNKPDAGETVDRMLEDSAQGAVLEPPHPGVDAAEAMVRSAQPRYVSWEDWKRLQALEEERGKSLGRPRLKLTTVPDMLAALGSG
jgi:ferredoxin--NADP+ reductase